MPRHQFDLVIVGGGPAGLSAAGHAHDNGISYVLLEKTDHLSDTVFCYQKGKHVMSEPGLIPIQGPLRFEPGTRESILETWNRFATDKNLNIHFNQPLNALNRQDSGYILKTPTDEYLTQKVILAIGTQGSPRKLGVPGEDLPHVSSRLIDPDSFQDQDMIVVGGGDAAIEVAVALCEQNRVGMVVRTPEFVRVKEALEREALSREKSGQLTIYFSATVNRIDSTGVEIKTPEQDIFAPAQQVILKIGTQPPRSFLEGIGVQFPSKDREAQPVTLAHSETTVPGLYLIGSVSGKPLIKLSINQGFEVIEHILGREVEPADENILKNKLPFFEGTARERIRKAIRDISLLEAADEELLREVFLASTVRTVQAEEVIFSQNDYTDSFIIILDGKVGISVRQENNIEKQVAALGKGKFFGEMSLISGRRRSATATALEEITLIEIPRKPMLKLIHLSPSVKEILNRVYLLRAFQSYLFPDVPDHVLEDLVAQASLESLDKNQVVFNEGDPGDAFYLIRNGMVKISKKSNQKELVLAYLPAGNYFGEMALLSNSLRNATVTTLFPTELIRLSIEDFLGFIGLHPELKQRFSSESDRRSRSTMEAEVQPESGNILGDLIQQEVVIGTDVLLIDEYKCVRCNNCVQACEGVHEDGQSRLSLTGISFYNLLVPNSCRHCENPLCMVDCPPDAIARDPRGEVYIKDNCIGCGNCERNCPYDNIFMVHPKEKGTLWNWVSRLFSTPKEDTGKTIAVKCDLCRGLNGGPACVRSCPTGAAVRVNPEEYKQAIETLVVRKGEY